MAWYASGDTGGSGGRSEQRMTPNQQTLLTYPETLEIHSNNAQPGASIQQNIAYFTFNTWKQGDITGLFQNNSSIIFQHLVVDYGMGKEAFLQYLQLKSVLTSKINMSNNLLPSPLVEQIDKITNQKTNQKKIHFQKILILQLWTQFPSQSQLGKNAYELQPIPNSRPKFAGTT